MVAVPGTVRRLAGRSSDPERVRAAIRSLLDEAPELADALAADVDLRRGVVGVADVSRTLAQMLARDPQVVSDQLAELAVDRERADLDRSWRETEGDSPSERLRRWKRRELVRIVARDTSGLADLSTVLAEITALADAALSHALTAAEPGQPMAIIGLGKLGGRELNYGSDVDVVVVHEGDDHVAAATTRQVIALMAATTAGGVVWPVDLDLRPEGRTGALSRTPESYETYYQRWAESWELQALIRARCVAGDRDLANAFFDAVQPMVWHEDLADGSVPYLHEIKRRHEDEFWHSGGDELDVKRGRGGIRDVEFTAQILQLVHGRTDPAVRSPNTFEALDQLTRGGYIERDDAGQLALSLVHLRTVEHRLQLWEERQTHHLPDDPDELTGLARRLGYRDGDEGARFLADHRQIRDGVREIHERVFYRPVLDAVAGSGRLAEQAVADRLHALGFDDVDGALERLERITEGSDRTTRALRQLLPPALDWLGQSPDPDLGLFQLRLVTDGARRAGEAVAALRDSEVGATRLCQLLGSSRVVGDGFRTHPEVMARLDDDAWLDARRTRTEERRSLAVEGDADPGTVAGAIARHRDDTLLHLGIRDILGRVDLDDVGAALTQTAEVSFDVALDWLSPDVGFGVVGVGRLGGGNLAYPSDLDVLFVHDGDPAVARQVARDLVDLFKFPVAQARPWDLDTRLRPEGQHGALVRTVDEMAAYYERWADTWELQTMVKARPVGGDRDLGLAFVDAIAPAVYRPDFAATDEIRQMKERIEAERIPDDEDPAFHLKLGEGSLTDVEFAVQVLRLRYGHEREDVREPNPLAAIAALVEAELLDPEAAQTLTRSYRFCSRARNLTFLMKGSGGDALPVDSGDARNLGRLMGFDEPAGEELREHYVEVTRAARQVCQQILGTTEPPGDRPGRAST